jgi:hypothetical protein
MGEYILYSWAVLFGSAVCAEMDGEVSHAQHATENYRRAGVRILGMEKKVRASY